MPSPANIVLVGFMGTGKSCTGRIVAERLGWEHVDTDDLIEAGAGRTIPEIFTAEGEEAFRTREREAVREAAGGTRRVVTVGGGAILDPRNVALLEANGLVVCLTADVDVILRRVAPTGHRPLLEGGEDKAQRIRRLLDERRSHYARFAHQIDTSTHTPADTAEAVLRLYRTRSAA